MSQYGIVPVIKVERLNVKIMDAKIKRILCDSAEEKLVLIFEDKGVKYYRKGRLFSASEEQLRTGKGEAYALLTSKCCSKDMYEASQKDIIL